MDMSWLLSIGGIVVALGAVVFIHEFGHFIVAKKSGIKVEQFSFGFGKEIVGFQMGETRYTINWLPLGGYVRMAGEFSEGYEGPVLEGKTAAPGAGDRSRDFMAQPWYRRILVALAGPAMNYVLAIVLFFGVLMVWGQRDVTNDTEIGEVMAGMPAEQAGLQPGDVIVEIDGEPMEDFISIAATVAEQAGEEMAIEFQRDGETRNVVVVPAFNEEEGRGLIGIRPADPIFVRERIGPVTAFKTSVAQTWMISATTLGYLGEKITSFEKPEDVAGPIGIFQLTSRAVKSGLESFLMFIGFISVAIGLFNLFPIPMLDGGHVLYYLIEGARGRPLSPKAMGKANIAGLALLLGILAFATLNDIRRLQGPESPAPAAAE